MTTAGRHRKQGKEEKDGILTRAGERDRESQTRREKREQERVIERVQARGRERKRGEGGRQEKG